MFVVRKQQNKIVVINLGEFIINSFLLFDVLNIQKNYIRDYNKKNKRALSFYQNELEQKNVTRKGTLKSTTKP